MDDGVAAIIGLSIGTVFGWGCLVILMSLSGHRRYAKVPRSLSQQSSWKEILMTYETTNQHPTDGDFGGTNLDAAKWVTFFTGDCDECSFVGPRRQSSMQAEDDLDEHKAVAHGIA